MGECVGGSGLERKIGQLAEVFGGTCVSRRMDRHTDVHRDTQIHG